MSKTDLMARVKLDSLTYSRQLLLSLLLLQKKKIKVTLPHQRRCRDTEQY